MPDKEVPLLQEVDFPLDGSEKIYVVQGANSRRVTLTDAVDVFVKNTSLFSLKIASLDGEHLGMPDGFAEPFTGENYVDTGGSVNQVYDGIGKSYKPYVAPIMVSAAAGTPIGDLTGSGGLNAAYDGDTVQTRNDSAVSTGNINNVDRWIGKDWGGGNEKIITQATVYGPSNAGVHEFNTNVRLRIQESVSGVWGGEEVTLSDTGIIDTSAFNFIRTLDCFGGSSVRYHRLLVSAGTNNSFVGVAELEFAEAGAISNMELISEISVASNAPNIGLIALQVKENEAVTINTDITASVQRVAGGDWELATLALTSESGGLKFYEDISVDLSVQASDTDMRWKVNVNSKDVEIHGIVQRWR